MKILILNILFLISTYGYNVGNLQQDKSRHFIPPDFFRPSFEPSNQQCSHKFSTLTSSTIREFCHSLPYDEFEMTAPIGTIANTIEEAIDVQRRNRIPLLRHFVCQLYLPRCIKISMKIEKLCQSTCYAFTNYLRTVSGSQDMTLAYLIDNVCRELPNEKCLVTLNRLSPSSAMTIEKIVSEKACDFIGINAQLPILGNIHSYQECILKDSYMTTNHRTCANREFDPIKEHCQIVNGGYLPNEPVHAVQSVEIVDGCQSKPCGKYGTCLSKNGGKYKCQCFLNYHGAHCDKLYDYCGSNSNICRTIGHGSPFVKGECLSHGDNRHLCRCIVEKNREEYLSNTDCMENDVNSMTYIVNPCVDYSLKYFNKQKLQQDRTIDGHAMSIGDTFPYLWDYSAFIQCGAANHIHVQYCPPTHGRNRLLIYDELKYRCEYYTTKPQRIVHHTGSQPSVYNSKPTTSHIPVHRNNINQKNYENRQNIIEPIVYHQVSEHIEPNLTPHQQTEITHHEPISLHSQKIQHNNIANEKPHFVHKERIHHKPIEHQSEVQFHQIPKTQEHVQEPQNFGEFGPVEQQRQQDNNHNRQPHVPIPNVNIRSEVFDDIMEGDSHQPKINQHRVPVESNVNHHQQPEMHTSMLEEHREGEKHLSNNPSSLLNLVPHMPLTINTNPDTIQQSIHQPAPVVHQQLPTQHSLMNQGNTNHVESFNQQEVQVPAPTHQAKLSINNQPPQQSQINHFNQQHTSSHDLPHPNQSGLLRNQQQHLPSHNQEQHLPSNNQEQHLPQINQQQHLPSNNQQQHLPSNNQQQHLPQIHQQQHLPQINQQQHLPQINQEQHLPQINQQQQLPQINQQQHLPSNNQQQHLPQINQQQHLPQINQQQHLPSNNQQQHLSQINQQQHLTSINQQQHLPSINQQQHVSTNNDNFAKENVHFIQHQPTESQQHVNNHFQSQQSFLQQPEHHETTNAMKNSEISSDYNGIDYTNPIDMPTSVKNMFSMNHDYTWDGVFNLKANDTADGNVTTKVRESYLECTVDVSRILYDIGSKKLLTLKAKEANIEKVCEIAHKPCVNTYKLLQTVQMKNAETTIRHCVKILMEFVKESLRH
ncbi:hypothetical protein SNEBB_009694 [Seison nebaliae]|nr:hypothetical protein SNEBB_009694 [Seison nebaliae]